MKFDFKEDGKRLFFVTLSSILMALNIKSFVRTGGLYPGGVTGLTLLLQRIGEMFFQIKLPYTVLNLVLNAFPVYIGFRFIGKKFTMYSCYVIVLTSILTDIIPGYIITYDTLLLSVFGGILSGISVSMCLLMGATTGGTDFIGLYFSEKKGVDSWNMVLGINVVILLAAGFLFGWEKALYSIIFQYVSTQVLHMRYNKFQQQTLFIITNQAKEVCKVIARLSNHGATIIEGEGSYDRRERSMVYSVVSRAESKRVIQAIKEVDAGAFINTVRTDYLSGRFYQKPEE